MTQPALMTAEQVRQELDAERIFRSPAIAAAIERMVDLASQQPQAQTEAGAATLYGAMAELAFAFILRGLNGDPARPRVSWDQNAPHRVEGMEIPGSRCTGNNPDNIYRRCPVDPRYRYALHGELRGPLAPDLSFSILPSVDRQENWVQAVIATGELDVGADGKFTILLDANETAGRRNHLHLAPGAIRLTIRESMTDWAVDTPMALRIERLGMAGEGASTPPGEPLDHVALAARFAEKLPGFASHWLGFARRAYFASAANAILPPKAPPGGLASQSTTMGNYDLRVDEALVIDADSQDAAYFAFEALDPWMRATAYRERTQSLTARQAIPGADGRYTFVLSLRDPGVHNWIDLGGLASGTLQCRWQTIPPRPGHGQHAPLIHGAKVPFAHLADHLPDDIVRVDRISRARQQAERAAAHDRRFTV